MDIKNKKILVTCGPTWVPIDDTRVISNISTGELGHLIAHELVKAGAHVTLLEGPVSNSLRSPLLRTIKFKYYDELLKLFKTELKKKYSVIIHAAAISDYQLNKAFNVKISSRLKSLTLKLIPTQKIINVIKKIAPESFLIGFKLETRINKTTAVQKGQRLIKEAGCDAVVVNSLSHKEYSAFIVNRNLKVMNHSKNKKNLSQQIVQYLKMQC